MQNTSADALNWLFKKHENKDWSNFARAVENIAPFNILAELIYSQMLTKIFFF